MTLRPYHHHIIQDRKWDVLEVRWNDITDEVRGASRRCKLHAVEGAGSTALQMPSPPNLLCSNTWVQDLSFALK